MVSFQCNGCGDTLKKPKLDQHAQRCRQASFSCLDCSTDFRGTDYRSHTSCISEAEKYEKTVYKGPKKKQNQQQQPQPPKALPPHLDLPSAAPSTSTANGNGQEKKRAREEDIVVDPSLAASTTEEPSPKKKKNKKDKKAANEEVAVEVEPVVEVEVAAEATDGESKKSKKDKKKKDKAPVADLADPVTPPVDAVPAPTIHAFLDTLLPTLLTTSQPLSSLLFTVLTSASSAGFTDAKEVERVLWEGVWVGGDKPKKMLLLNFKKKERKRGKKGDKAEKVEEEVTEA